MCYCFLHSPYCCEKKNNDNAECLASFSDSIHKNVNTNLIFFSFFSPIMHVFQSSASFPSKFFSLKLELNFHYFCDYAKGYLGKNLL